MRLASPVWRGSSRGRSGLLAFGVGLVLGGASTGLVLGAFGVFFAWVPGGVGLAVVVVVAALAALDEFGLARVQFPQTERQIPEEVFIHRPPKAGLRFGFELGLGFRTFVSANAPYVVVVAIVLLGPGVLGCVAAGAAFGAGRFAMAVDRYLSASGESWDGALARQLPAIRRLALALSVVGAVVLSVLSV